MDAQAFTELTDEILRLHRAGDYGPALELATREASRFPERAGRIGFWRACLAARLNDTPLALEVLAEALASGYWWPASMLREEKDLQPLQGLPEFERLVALSREQQRAVQAEAKPDLLVLEPAIPAGKSMPLLLALHGSNQNAGDAAEAWRPAVDAGWLVALPESGQVSWDGRDPRARMWTDRDQAVRELESHWASLQQRYPITPQTEVLAGFSAGGQLALWLVLSGTLPIHRCFLVAPSLLPGALQQLLPLVEPAASRGPAVYIVVGDHDRWSTEGACRMVEALREHGVACDMEVHAGLSHEFPPDFERSLTRGLGFLLGQGQSEIAEATATL